MQGQRQATWPVTSLSMPPILIPPKASVQNSPVALRPCGRRVTASPASTPLRGRPGQEEVCFSSCPRVPRPGTTF